VIYLSGTWSTELLELTTGADPIGVVVTPAHRTPRWYIENAHRAWGADNGCFAHPERFDLQDYIEWLDGLKWHGMTCLFATAPDVVGDARATWERSAPVFEKIRALRLPAALVAQDGFDEGKVDWDAFDTLFLGGTTAWKERHSEPACRTAKRHGKWLHMGRVNSARRMAIARRLGCASCDGNFLAFGPRRNLPRLRQMLENSDRQTDMFAIVPEPRPDVVQEYGRGDEMKAIEVLKRLEWTNWACPICGASKVGSGRIGTPSHIHRHGCEMAIAIGAQMEAQPQAVERAA